MPLYIFLALLSHTFGFPEETLLPLPDPEDALFFEFVRRLSGQGGQLSLVEPHLGRVLDGL